MIAGFTWVLAFGLLSSSSVFAMPDPYILATHPKGGTNLLMKALNMIHGYRSPSLFGHYEQSFHPEMINECWLGGGMPIVHLFLPNFTYSYFLREHLDFKIIAIIRDLRDAYVSYAHWIYNSDISEEEKIDRIFEDIGYFEMSKGLSVFINDCRFYIVRFEDLIGPKGGGDKEKQTKTIYELANYIGMPISEMQASLYGDQLFGDSSRRRTFRNGQIGSWKKAFNESQKKWFKEHFGDELIRLGYEHDYEW